MSLLRVLQEGVSNAGNYSRAARSLSLPRSRSRHRARKYSLIETVLGNLMATRYCLTIVVVLLGVNCGYCQRPAAAPPADAAVGRAEVAPLDDAGHAGGDGAREDGAWEDGATQAEQSSDYDAWLQQKIRAALQKQKTHVGGPRHKKRVRRLSRHIQKRSKSPKRTARLKKGHDLEALKLRQEQTAQALEARLVELREELKKLRVEHGSVEQRSKNAQVDEKTVRELRKMERDIADLDQEHRDIVALLRELKSIGLGR